MFRNLIAFALVFTTEVTAQSLEPSGYQRIAEINWNAISLAHTTSLDGLLAGGVSMQGSNFAIETHSDAPFSPQRVLRLRYPATLKQGVSPGQFVLKHDPATQQFEEIYVRFFVKIDGPNFENHPVGTKLFGYFGSGRTRHTSNQNYWLLSGGSGDTGFGAKLMTGSTIRFLQQDVVNIGRSQNVNTGALFKAGRWHRIEYRAVLSDIDVPNGEFHMWIDGVKIHQHTDVVYRTSVDGFGGGFFGIHNWTPVWGGNVPGTQRTRDDDVLIDHFYISGITLGSSGSAPYAPRNLRAIP